MEENYLSGCKIGGRGEEEELELSHLLYADDTFLFSKDNLDHLVHMGWILMWFEGLLGLKINFGKSKIFPIGGRENVEALTTELGCKVGTLLTTYLGLPLRTSTSQSGCGVLLRKGLGGDWLFGSANIFLKGEELHLSETPYQTFLSTSCLFFRSRVWCAKG